MSLLASRRFQFETAEQWNACLFRGADRESRGARAGMTPLAPFSYQPQRIPSAGATAPCVTRAGEILWHDATRLLRALPIDESAQSAAAPWSLTQAPRLVATHDAVWVAGIARGTLECFDLQTLARRRVIELHALTVLDLARLRRDALLILARRNAPGEDCEHLLLELDCSGRATIVAVLEARMLPIQIGCLATKDSARVALLSADRTRLFGVDLPAGRENHQPPARLDALWTVQLGALRACFKALRIASDERARFLIAGAEGPEFGSQPYALVLDRDATLVDALSLSSAATGVAGGRSHLIVSHAEGIAIHARTTRASDVAGVGSDLITPLLRAPDSDSEIKWQRANVWANLPVGTSLELRYGYLTDPEMRASALRLTRDRPSLSQAQKFARLEDMIENWSTPVTFSGSDVIGDASAPFAFSLLDARVPEIWIHVRVRATPRAELPSISRMSVSYAGSALLQQLPAVFRRTAVQPGDFLGTLVGLLEATTQELDRRIGGLGSLVHPNSAPPAWLDQLAEWLGLPWDDALAPPQKRAIVRAAARLAEQRGTRAGLATLLECLFPGDPPRFRITDVDVDFGFASLGGRGCCGSALPAVLAGLPRSAAVLSRKAILGAARLPCEGQEPNATQRLAGNLRIDLEVGAEERAGAQQWLARLIDSVVPATSRVALRWHAPRGTYFDGFGELPPAPLAHLGANAVTGIARLPDSGARTLL